MGGMAAANQTYDAHGRVTCFEADDSRMSKLIFSDSTSPVRIDVYGKSGTCSSGGTVDHKSWMGYDYNSNSQSLRPAWVRRTSVYSGAADCSGASLPANCYENKFTYVSSTDDRLQTLTTTGYTWNQVTDSSATQRAVKQRTYYFGLDTGVCTSGDSYTGLPCRVERQDNAGSPRSPGARPPTTRAGRRPGW
jgi:hypothetical protein